MEPTRFNHYRLGIEQLDKDHYELIQLLSACTIAIRNKESIDDLLTEVNSKLNLHFISEEKFMLDIKYPYLEYHVLIHREISKRFNRTILTSTESTTISKYLVNTLEECIIGHIDEYDMQIKAFIDKQTKL